MGSPPGQGSCPLDGQQVHQTSTLFAAAQVMQPAEIGSLSPCDMECSDIPSDASHAVPLREGWVSALEDQLQRKFTKFYNCNVTGRSITSENIPCDGHFSIAPDEHALYFLPVMTAREILRVMSNHNQAVLKHGKSSACFILPKRKAEWNWHMKNLGNLIDTSKHSILDQDV